MADPNFLTTLINAVQPLPTDNLVRARAHQDSLVKPRGSLGQLETVANRFAALQNTLYPTAHPRCIAVFIADHGICAEGVNAYPQAVTWQHTLNFLNGGAAVNILAKQGDAATLFVDVGVDHDFGPVPGLSHRKVRRGTRNFARVPAMTRTETMQAIRVGADIVADVAHYGTRVVVIGEMGIGNTTSASAIAAILTGAPAAAVTGAGSGLDAEAVKRKSDLITRALLLHRPDAQDPLDILDKVGGLEIAAMCGACLAAAANGVIAVVDGFIATVAAAVACRLCPLVREYLILSHASVEPGHRLVCDLIGLRPLLNLDLRLGEASGAALVLPIIDAALMLFAEMKTFEASQVSDRQ